MLKDTELLTGGQFATTYRVTLTDGRRVIVKTAPTRTDQLLAYEHDLLRAEALVYGLAASVPDLKMPQVLLTDFTRTVLPSDALVVSHLPGVPLVDAGFGPSDPRTAAAERGTGEVLAALHRLTGPAFGYPCGRQASTWAESFTGMIDELLDDAARWSVPVPPTTSARPRWPGTRTCSPTSTDPSPRPHRPLGGQPVRRPVHRRAASASSTPSARSGATRWRTSSASTPWAASPGRPPCWRGTGRWTSTSPSARTRLELYRMRLCLVMMIEITPRKFEGDWVEPHRTAVTANLHAALAALA